MNVLRLVAADINLHEAMVGCLSQMNLNKKAYVQQLFKNCVKVVKLIGIFKLSLRIISALVESVLALEIAAISLTKKAAQRAKAKKILFLQYRSYSIDEILSVLE
jgi:hypothetical protein